MDASHSKGENEVQRGDSTPGQIGLPSQCDDHAEICDSPEDVRHLSDSSERRADEPHVSGDPQRPLYLVDDESGEPQRPLDSDCCGNGCSPCVFDLYERDVAAWRRRRRQLVVSDSSCPAPPSDSSCGLRPDRFTPLLLRSVAAVSDAASLYTFSLPSGGTLRLPAGAHLRLRETDHDGRVVTRAYTPVFAREAAGSFDVYIRRYASGVMSACVRRWQVGDSALWSGPFGSYRPRAADARLAMLAAGTGVAPFVCIVRQLLADEESETRLTLLLAVRRLSDVFPREELVQWARHWNFTYLLFVSGGEEDGVPARYGEPVRWRRIGTEDVHGLVQQGVGTTRYLVCGTRSFEKDMLNYLGEADVSEDHVFRF